jgi:hypothetical protein
MPCLLTDSLNHLRSLPAALAGSFLVEMLNSAALRQMHDVNVAPAILEVLRHESTVTVMGFVFAAKQAPVRDRLLRDSFLDPALSHQIEKLPLVILPVAACLLRAERARARSKKGRQNVPLARARGRRIRCRVP